MDLHLWFGFALACFVLGVIPGPGVASIVGFAFSSGRRVALASVAGMAIGNAVAISVSLMGAGAILASSALAFAILKWIGAAYLIAIGLIAIARSGRDAPPGATPARRLTARAALLTNVAVGTLHPKTILFFLAFATQFIAPDRAWLPQAAIMVASFTLIAATTDTLYALAAARAAGLVRNARLMRLTGSIGGGMLVAAGVATATLRR